MQQEFVNSGKIKLYKRRWAFLAALMYFQFLAGWAYSCFGQINNFYVKFFRQSYSVVYWLTTGDTLAPVLTTLPLAWFAYKGFLGFRKLSISGAIFSALGYMCIAISTASRSFYPVAFVGQILNGFAMQLLLATPPIFAVMWFPEEEVGSAISLNVFGLYIGGILGLIIPATSLHLDFSNATTVEQHLTEDNYILMIIYVLFTVIALVISIFFIVFLTDRPPTPPTEAQRFKTDSPASKTVPATFWGQTKAIFTNRTAVLGILAMGIIWEICTVEITTMSRIIENFVSNHDAMGAYVMTVFYIGSAFGALTFGKVVDAYKRYKVLTLTGAGLAFASSVAIVISDQCKSYLWVCTSNLIFGAASQASLVVGFEILTQQTFPLDENLVSIFVVGCILPTSTIFGEIAEVIYKAWGGIAVLVFQSLAVLTGLILCCFFKIENKRLAADKGFLPSADEEMSATTSLLNGKRNDKY